MKWLLSLLICVLLCFPARATVTEPSASNYPAVFNCDGGTTAFTCNFKIGAAAEVRAVLRAASGVESTLVLNSDYTIAVTNSLYPATSFTLTTTATYASGNTLVVATDIGASQTANLTYNNWQPNTVMLALDKTMRLLWQLQDDINRCFKVPFSNSRSESVEVPTTTTATGYLYWDGDSVSLESGTSGAGAGDPNIGANDVNEVHIQLTYNSWLVSTNAAGNGDIQLIKGGPGDVAVLGPGAQTYDSSAPDSDAEVSNKKYVDDQLAAMHLANNTYLKAHNAAGDGWVSLIKANASDVAVIPDGSETATSGAPTQDADIANKKYVDDTVATHKVTAAGTTVFNAAMTASGTFQDLDLSATVGSNTALVFLQVTTNGVGHYCVKPKGFGGAYAAHTNNASDLADNGGGCCAAAFEAASEYHYFTVMTNSSGVVQQAYSDNSDTVTVVVVGYFK